MIPPFLSNSITNKKKKTNLTQHICTRPVSIFFLFFLDRSLVDICVTFAKLFKIADLALKRTIAYQHPPKSEPVEQHPFAQEHVTFLGFFATGMPDTSQAQIVI